MRRLWLANLSALMAMAFLGLVAGAACGKSNDELLAALSSRDPKLAKEAEKEVRSRMPGIEADIIRQLELTTDPFQAMALLSILEGSPSPTLRTAAIELTNSTDPRKQRIGTVILTQNGTCTELPDGLRLQVSRMLQSQEPESRYAALSCIARDKNKGSRDRVKAYLANSVGQETKAVIDILGSSKDKYWMPSITTFLWNKDSKVRFSAIVAGMQLDEQRMRKLLMNRGPDPDPEVRKLYENILGP